MNFLTYKKLHNDVREFSGHLPSDICMVVGVPRSGLMVATLLALHRNIPVMSVDDFIADCESPKVRTLRRSYGFGFQHVGGVPAGQVLVLDDTVLRGTSINAVKKRLDAAVPSAGPFIYGAMYVSKGGRGFVDWHHSVVPQRRVMEWNVFHSHVQMQKALLDIDGVICEDWTGTETIDDPTYLNHLRSAKPLHIPSARVGGLCTGRLERYREQTEAYLRSYHVKYDALYMHPAETPQARRAGQPKYAAIRKAEIYRDGDFNLFIESSSKHAQTIAEVSKKPVICTDTMTLHEA